MHKLPALGIILLHICFIPVASAQKGCAWFDLTREAETLYRQNKALNTAMKQYRKAFDVGLSDASMLLDALTVAALEQDSSNVAFFMEKGLSIGLSPSDYRNLWPQLGNGMDLNHFLSRIDSVQRIQKYQEALDSSLCRRLKRLAENDQKFRGQGNEDLKQQQVLDSLNWLELKNIIAPAGRLPLYKELGLEGFEHLRLLFYHMDAAPLEWFLPYVWKSIQEDYTDLGHLILYQLDRIGMGEGKCYTITDALKIVELGPRTKMKNGYYCQNFGEWFSEKSRIDNNTYETPYDPTIPESEINRVRLMFCMGTMAEKRQLEPWVKVLGIADFERLVRE